jgi:hypothetical protein
MQYPKVVNPFSETRLGAVEKYNRDREASQAMPGERK